MAAFREAHPEIRITPPCLQHGPYWHAFNEAGDELAYAYWLEWFMDKLDGMFPPETTDQEQQS